MDSNRTCMCCAYILAFRQHHHMLPVCLLAWDARAGCHSAALVAHFCRGVLLASQAPSLPLDLLSHIAPGWGWCWCAGSGKSAYAVLDTSN